MPTETKQATPLTSFNTPDAGRDYIAKLFETVLRRHDYRQYITERLAGDFACMLAQQFEDIKARESALHRRLTAADEQVDRLKRVAHLAAEDSAALQKRVHALTEALDQIYGWCGAFLDDDMDMPKTSVKALRDLIAKALPIHGELLGTH